MTKRKTCGIWLAGACAAFCLAVSIFAVTGCSVAQQESEPEGDEALSVSDAPAATEEGEQTQANDEGSSADAETSKPQEPTVEQLRAELNITEMYYPEFSHGEKTAEYQKYIVLHDTEGEGDPASVASWWASNGNLIAAHFVVGKDGSIVQCVPLDEIAHHAGYGDAGHNELYGVEDESRDDMLGTTPIGSWAPDYGMNSYSVGIEMVHVGGSGDYPEAQLEALDKLIAYIDAYYGFESEIIDHKAWRTGNSDTSPEFATYFESYKMNRVHAL